MNTFVWIVQGFLASVFLAHGLLFLFPPKAIRKIKKQLSFPVGLMQFVYVAEVLAAFGLTLPGLTGILTWLIPLAAAGLVPIMVGATMLHVSRREVPPSVVTAFLLALAVLVAFTRWFVFPL